MTRIEALKQDKSFYGDFDETSDTYCVFGDNSGFVYSVHGSQAAADAAAIEMDKQYKKV